MMFSMSELRGISTGTNKISFHEMTMDEAVTWLNDLDSNQLVLSEAFYGRNQVSKIQKAMDEIQHIYMSNHDIDMRTHKANRALEKAICDCFGFRRATVYWVHGPDVNDGAYTCPASHVFTDDGAYIKIGENKNGFYDKDHRINIAIGADLCMFRDPYNLTSEEMVALFLHEIGHNFDYTMWAIVDAWFVILETILDIIDEIMAGKIPKAVGHGIGAGIGMLMKNYPSLSIYLSNLPDLFMNIIPPIGQLARIVGRAVSPFMKLVFNVLLQVGWVTTIPISIMKAPLNMFVNVFTNKGEIFADSFAAAYGYGGEFITGMDKIDMYQIDTSVNLGPITDVLNDLALLQQEILMMCRFNHGSTQQRAIKIADSLEESLRKSGLSDADKKAIRKEKERVMSVYNQYIELDDDRKHYLTTMFRQMVDNWYGGKSYAFIPEVDKNYAG